MVGLCLAHQLLERGITSKIVILDKETKLGKHSSGRNSGVLHAGLYYKPGSLKAKVCVNGSRRLRNWVEERGLPINPCGKVIVPQRLDLDKQLDILLEMGRSNGATVEIWDESQLHQYLPEARTASGRALWSPNTAVVKPMTVMRQLEQELRERGVSFVLNRKSWTLDPKTRQLCLSGGEKFTYGHLINTAGLQADRIAHLFGVGNHFTLLPFKGFYWQLKPDCPIQPWTNLYPVPDLDIPFLGVHFTPSADSVPVVSIGPTATPSLGRENYRGLDSFELMSTISNFSLLTRQYLRNRNGFRNYVHEQAFLALPPLFLRSAQSLIPSLSSEHLELSQKVGIRPQLFNRQTQQLENDFLCLPGPASTHVLNAISPAFTASFALADLILDQIEFKNA